MTPQAEIAIRVLIVYVLAFTIILGSDLRRSSAGLWWWASDQIAAMRFERVVERERIVEKRVIEREIVERVIRQTAPATSPAPIMAPSVNMMSSAVMSYPCTMHISAVVVSYSHLYGC